MQRSLHRMIEFDTLTGIFNRRCANRKLKQLVEKNVETNTPFSICVGDIDFFKKVNDTYGHDCGDEVLKTIATIMKEHMAPLGFVARWGGEEFLLVFDNMDQEAAAESLKKLLYKIRSTEILYNGETVRVTMTFGVTDNTATDINEMFKAADHKLYDGKMAGRNRVVL